jgi:hypothetical protein
MMDRGSSATPEWIAYHEAGHGVVRFAAGLGLRYVTIEGSGLDQSPVGGHVRLTRAWSKVFLPVWDRKAIRRVRRRLIRDIGFLCGGMAAETIRYPKRNDQGQEIVLLYTEEDEDFYNAMELARIVRMCDLGPKVEPDEAAAEEIVLGTLWAIRWLLKQPDMWVQVEALAELLLERGTVSGWEAELACVQGHRNWCDGVRRKIELPAPPRTRRGLRLRRGLR